MTTKTTATTASSGRNVASELAYLTRTLKASSLAAAVERLAERARSEGWTHEEFLAACLQREVAAREAHGGEGRIRAARFPARKSLEDFDVEHQRSLKREVLAHLGTLDFIANKDNVVFLGPPGTGKTHLTIGLGVRACQAGHRTAFATAAEWVARLATAHHTGRLQTKITKLGRTPLVIVDLCRHRDYAEEL
jgi:DNA replication protein DnaC